MSQNKTDSEYFKNAHGGEGVTFITGTAAVTGKFMRIEAEGGGAVINNIVIAGVTHTGVAWELLGGQGISGNFITSVTLTSGKVIAYKAFESGIPST